MCSMQLVWYAHLTSSLGISIPFGVQSFWGTRRSPGFFEPCDRFVWIRVWGWQSHFQWRTPEFRANRRSFHGYLRGLVLICILWELSWVFWSTFVRLYLGPAGDVPGAFGTGDVSTEVETDVPASKRRAVVTRRLIPLAVDGGGLYVQMCLCWKAFMNCLSRHLTMVWRFCKGVSF